jgi:protein pelota
MRVIRFNGGEGTLKLRVETVDDLWTVQRVVFPGDFVKSESMRKFKSVEGDKGEMKEVMITLSVEKTEFDKAATRLRVLGKITEGRPLEYVRLNSYHTLNIALDDVLEIRKTEWPDYLVSVLKNAVKDTKKPRLGIIVVDDEKALPAYLLGYGLEFRSEMYSRLSKRMSQKEFQEQQKKYFDEIINTVTGMNVDTIIMAGPGFTVEDIRKYAEQTGALKKSGKMMIYEAVSNAERSAVYELIKGDKVAELLHKERIRAEFKLMEEFLNGLSTGKSKSGTEAVKEAVEGYEATVILVNDSVLGNQGIQRLLGEAEEKKLKIEVFNSSDEVGTQLHSFKDIACF